MFLVAAAVIVTISLGLLLLRNWARRVAALVAMIGIVLLIPAVSSAVIGFRFSKLVRGGLEIVGWVIFVFYLYQPRVREAFEAK